MGFFNFWYNLKFFLRRMPKKILVAICIFLIVCIAHLKGYCTYVEDYQLNYMPTDVIQAYKLEYDVYAYRFIRECITQGSRNGGTLPSTLQLPLRQIAQGTDIQTYFNFMPAKYMNLYIKENNSSVNINGYSVGLFITTATPTSSQNYSYEYALTSSTVEYGELVQQYFQQGRFVTLDTFHHSYTSSTTNNKAWLLMAFTNYIPPDLYDTIYQLATNTFNYNMAQTTLTTIDNHIQELNQQIENMNDFLQDDTTSQYTQNDLPSDSMNDITASEFNGIFTKIYNKFTQASVEPISLTLPYMNYTFTVSPYYLYNAIYSIGWTPLYNLITLMWYYGISLYIVKDIYKYINQIKNGNISHTDTNIKTEML